jgi:crotonobetainyl-CoA:carnitine CoA-transferase CaiB-like acyl-CoA transferase
MKLLEGNRVLDASWLLPGPILASLLGDMGADVIKVEVPPGGDYLRQYRSDGNTAFHWATRNKRGVVIDFHTSEGRGLLLELARNCQVFVEGARPGALARRGLGYDDLKAVNPQIVYCSITGFGQTGPFAHMGTHGGAYDAATGLAVPYALPDGGYVQHRPYPHGLIYGSWLGAMSICAALVRAQRSGEGSYLDISCADATLMALGQAYLGVFNGGPDPFSDPDAHLWARYCYYKTSDGRFMLIQALEKHFWEHFCTVAGRPDLAGRGDWSASRMDFATGDLELRDELIRLFAGKTQAEWTQIFVEHDIAGAPYYPPAEVADTELFRTREMILEQPAADGRDYRFVGNAIKRAGDPFELRPAPELGQHTDEVLAELGVEPDRIVTLRASGVIG